MVKDDIERAVCSLAPGDRPYSLRHDNSVGPVSFGDLMTDLAPFIEAEIRKAVEAERAVQVAAFERVSTALRDATERLIPEARAEEHRECIQVARALAPEGPNLFADRVINALLARGAS